MGYLKIHCHNCKNTFEMYWDDIENEDNVRCPHCLVTMNKEQWDKLVNAYFTIEEVNKGLRNRHEVHGEPLLQVEYRTRYIEPEMYHTD